MSGMWAGIIGGGAALLGGVMSSQGASGAAKADRQAGVDARNFQDKQGELGKLQNLVNQYGGVEGIRRYKAQATLDNKNLIFGTKATNPNFSEADKAQLTSLDQQIAKINNLLPQFPGTRGGQMRQQLAELEAQKATLTQKAGGNAGTPALVDEAAMLGSGPGILGKYDALAKDAGTQGANNLGGYDAETAALNWQAKDMQAGLDRFGAQKTARIKEDSSRSLTSANRAATASLMSRGMGAGSTMTEALQGNAAANQRAQSDALGAVEDQKFQIGTGLKTGRLGLLANRASGRSAMMLGGQDTQRSLQQGALNMEQNALSGNVMNPWLGQNVSQYFSSASPSAASAGAWGSALSGAGSTMMGYGMQQYLGAQNPNRSLNTFGGGNSAGLNNPYMQMGYGATSQDALAASRAGGGM